jgi:hypothetical protein
MENQARKIRIIAAPIGEAPDWVREAWVGLVLPVAGNPQPRYFYGFGVRTGPVSLLGNLWGLLLGKAQRYFGYPVYAGPAVELLEASNPDAAMWWRDNVPHMLRRGRLFLFNADACTLIGEAAATDKRS